METRDSAAVLLFPTTPGRSIGVRPIAPQVNTMALRRRSGLAVVDVRVPGRTPEEVGRAAAALGTVGRVGAYEDGVTVLCAVALSTGGGGRRAKGSPDPRTWFLVRVDREGHGWDLPVAALAEALGLEPSAIVVSDLDGPTAGPTADPTTDATTEGSPGAPADDAALPASGRAAGLASPEREVVLVLPATAEERELRPIGKPTAGTAVDVRQVGDWLVASWVTRAERAGADAAPEPWELALLGLASLTVHGPRESRRGLVLLREPGHTMLADVAEGELVGARRWTPAWADVVPDGIAAVEPAEALVSDLLDEVRPDDGEDQFGGWGADAVRRRTALRRPEPDLVELLDVLGLPAEVLEVLDGTSSSPAVRHDAVGALEMVRQEAARSTPFDGWVDRHWRLYVVGSVLWCVVTALVLGPWRGETSLWVRVVVGVLAVGQVVDVLVRWRGRVRRRGDATANG